MTSSEFTDANPFFDASALPFAAPPFDRIRDAHFSPAIDEGMRLQLDEIAVIADNPDPATFENTLVALERSGALLTRVLKAFIALTAANTNDALQDVQREQAPRLAAHSDAIYLNAALFARVQAIHEQRDALGLSAEQKHLVERYQLVFERAGARLPDDQKARMRALNQEESQLTTEFQSRLLAATKAAAFAIDDPADLDGLDEADLAAAEAAATERDVDARWLLPLQNTTQQPLLEKLRRRDVRERIFRASVDRARRGDDVDTRALVERLSRLRAEQAAVLGYETAADYVLDDQMARTPEAAIKLLTDLAGPAAAKARREAARIQRVIDERARGDGAAFELEPWDWQHYAEQVRKAEYDLDEAQIRPYFELERVVRDGLFHAATQLFGITFRARDDLPTYHPDVRVYEVIDADGAALALFYADYFKRDNKSGGAWMDSFVDQSWLLGTKPVVVNVTNFTKPAAGQALPLGFDEVTTLFHEFGHALHGMFSRVEYPMLSGTNVPRDFVEFPSQFNEHWALEPSIFANYAKHHETGEPMPAALVDRIKKARTFNQGYALTEYIAAALIDMAWHTLAPGEPTHDVDAFEAEALRRYGIDVREVPPRYYSSYFAHIWDGGYQAGYFAYLWAEVLDHDAYAWFEEQGGLTRANGDRFRRMILSRGGTQDPASLYREFRGRDPSVEPLLAARGLASAPVDA